MSDCVASTKAPGLLADQDQSPEARDEQASQRDVQARDRDSQAAQRDRQALGRDTRERSSSDDGDAGFPARFLSAGDRDDAAGDRADALRDRNDARRDREHAAAEREHVSIGTSDGDRDFQQALEERAVIGQAQGLLMGDMGLTPDEAFDVLRFESQSRNLGVREVATELVQGHRRRNPTPD